MGNKTYPIGTRIRFIADKYMQPRAQGDDGKIGTIVKVSNSMVWVYLPESHHNYNGKEITWSTRWECVAPIVKKNQQLLFDFAYER